MQIVLNIDESNFTGTIGNVFDSLMDEDKKNIFKEMILSFLSEPNGAERKLHEENLIQKVRKGEIRLGYDSNKDWSNASDQEIRSHYDFHDKMRGFVSVKEKMIKEVVTQATIYINENIKKFVETDPQISEVLAKVKEDTASRYPSMVQEALINWFSSQMQYIFSTLMQVHNLQADVDNITNKIHGR